MALGGPKDRAVLARLALAAGRAVSDDHLIDAVWGDEPPRAGSKVLQNCVLRLRKSLGADAIVRERGGYQLNADLVDVGLAESLAEQARAATEAGNHAEASRLYTQALGVWRGAAFPELQDIPFVPAATARLVELKWAITERRIDAELARGNHDAVVGELEYLTKTEPLRERFWAQRMVALYRSGRQAEALRTYQELRSTLADELGLSPSPELVELERAIVAQSSELQRPAERLPSGTVSFLMTDIEGSTGLLADLGPAYLPALEAHRTAVRDAVRAHGGTEVTTTGDGLLAVFPRSLDAAGAAVDSQLALKQCAWPDGRHVRVHMGVHAGHAAPTADGDYISITVNEVARVCDAAHGGQILLSDAAVEHVTGESGGHLTTVPLGKYRLRGFPLPVVLHQLQDDALGGEFPPLRAPAAGHNLPNERTTFVGRTEELDELTALLDANALVTVVGPGGVGKTRILLETAKRLASSYPDGVWLVRLGSISDGALVPDALAAALGVTEQPGASIVATVIERLERARLLLLVDNCEHLLDAAGDLLDEVLTACPYVRAVATSRQPLSLPAEAVLKLDPLPLPDRADVSPDMLRQFAAVALFETRAAQARAGFELSEANAEDILAICRSLDGLPLAIELVATLVRQVPLADLRRRVQTQLGVVSGRGREPRHTTLNAAIDWSYALLQPAERALFDRLSVFRGGFTLNAAERVCAGSECADGEVIMQLAALVDKSLVVFDDRSGRYRMLETIRHCAALHLDAEAEADLHVSYAAWCLGIARNIGVEGGESVRKVAFDAADDEHDNLRAALGRAEAGEDDELLARLSLALRPFWRVRGYFTEGRRWLGAVRSRAADSLVRAEAALGEGQFALLQGDYEGARGLFEEAADAFEANGANGEVARALQGLGQLASYRGDHIAAEKLLKEAAALFRSRGETGHMAAALHDLGRLASHTGKLDVAGEALSEALAAFRAVDDTRGIADVLHAMGRVDIRRGDLDAASVNLEEAFGLYTRLGDRRGVAASGYAVGKLALAQGGYDEARTHLTQSVERFRELRDPQGWAWPLHSLGAISAARGDVAAARVAFNEVLAVGRSLESGPLVMTSLLGLGDLAERDGDRSEARKLFEEALSLALEIGYRSEAAGVEERLSRLADA